VHAVSETSETTVKVQGAGRVGMCGGRGAIRTREPREPRAERLSLSSEAREKEHEPSPRHCSSVRKDVKSRTDKGSTDAHGVPSLQTYLLHVVPTYLLTYLLTWA